MIGYAAFVLLLFLPGLAAGLATRLFEKKRFSEIFAVSFGLSLVVTPIALLVSYAIFRAITDSIVYGLLIVSAGASVFLAWRNKGTLNKPTVNRLELFAFLMIPVQGILIALPFTKYPIFPSTISVDFRIHLQTALQIDSGQFSLSQVTYPPGIHFLFASLLAVEQGIAISIMQYGIAIIATFAPILVFVVVSKLLGDERLGVAASLIFVLSGAAWYIMLSVTGLYANFLANLVTLTVVYLIVEGTVSLDIKKAVLVLGGGVALYLSHYTIVVFVAILLLMLPLFFWKARDRFMNYLKMCGLIVAPGLAIAIARPNLVTIFLSIPELSGQSAGVVSSSMDPLAAFLGPISPFLNDLYQEVGIGLFLLALAVVPISVYLSRKKNVVWIPLALGWFLLTWIVTPYSAIAWRYSELAILPLLVLWPAAIQLLLPEGKISGTDGRQQVRRKKIRRNSEVSARLLLLGLIAVIIVVYSPIVTMLQDLNSDGPQTSDNQGQVYQAMEWLGTHGTPGKVLGLEDWRFSYMQPLWGFDVSIFANTNTTDAAHLVNQSGYRYVLVSQYLIPGPSTQNEGLNPYFKSFQNDTMLVPLFSNPSVAVYSVKQ